MPERQSILVLCTGNSCRSQMAEGFLRRFLGGEFDVFSAGTAPKDEVHPLAVRVMGEIGIDISAQRPKDVAGFVGRLPRTHLLIVCDRANDSCPRAWPGSLSRTYMPFDDPAHAVGTELDVLNTFRRVRDQIGEALRDWRPEPSSGPSP
ncbi:MAG: arsenate reductase ArsC [Phycisphaerae bacterium]|nr:arsenate reductase ArsC [Phycisphaerae bacterium]MDW8263231.1 arsenate reductase ArsC [Phycisphaerales bacterium]